MNEPPRQVLADLKPGMSASIASLDMDEGDAVRLMELGFVPSAQVSCQGSVPLGDLSVYQVDNDQVAIRSGTATRIRVSVMDGKEGDDVIGS